MSLLKVELRSNVQDRENSAKALTQKHLEYWETEWNLLESMMKGEIWKGRQETQNKNF